MFERRAWDLSRFLCRYEKFNWRRALFLAPKLLTLPTPCTYTHACVCDREWRWSFKAGRRRLIVLIRWDGV